MWIAKGEYDRLIETRGKFDAVLQRCAAQQTTNEWLMMRLTQLEHERAVLIQNYMGVKVPVPEIGKAAETVDIDQVLRDPGALFADMGDEAASAQGVDWDPTGTVTYGNRK